MNSILYRKSDTVNFLNLKLSFCIKLMFRILKWTIFILYCTIITNRLIWCCRTGPPDVAGTGPPDVVDQTERMLPEQVHRMLSIRLTGCSRTGPPDVACLKEFSMVFIIFKLYWPKCLFSFTLSFPNNIMVPLFFICSYIYIVMNQQREAITIVNQ